MTEKLPPLEPPLPGQDDRLYLDSSAECSAGHWYSPKLVADYIAEAIAAERELYRAAANEALPFCAQPAVDALRPFAEGAAECKPRPLVALTDEQISAFWDSGRNTVVGFTRLAIAAHCRLNGLPEPKP